MLIICPNCATSYDLDPAALGPAGRNVRCVRCRETWLARAEDMVEAERVTEPVEAMAGPAEPPQAATTQADAAQAEAGFVEEPSPEPPHVESPPLASEAPPIDVDYEIRPAAPVSVAEPVSTRFKGAKKRFAFGSGTTLGSRLRVSPPTVIAALAALCLALVIWRQDVVRLMPQTAAFFKTVGLNVNLRKLDFEGVKISSETVNGNRVIVIEGEITTSARKPTDIPRLRFVVQDSHGADIYAWNAVLDQAVIEPGGRVPFRSRLASPPADASSIVVRFFHRRDLAAGSI
ncbi:MAG: zinc-ribbon domain-containing protein [Xanthobacteraceae bacterium]